MKTQVGESLEAADHLLDSQYEVVGRWSAHLATAMGVALAALSWWHGSGGAAGLFWMAPGLALQVGTRLLPSQLSGRIVAGLILTGLAVALHAQGIVAVTLCAAVMVFLVLFRDPRVVAPAGALFVVLHGVRALSTHRLVDAMGEISLLGVTAALCMLLALALRERVVAMHGHRVVTERLQRELTVAKEDRQRAERRKSEFLSNISHEVRTPMHGVMAMTRLLLETRLTGEQRELAETLERSNRALLDMLSEILDYSAVETAPGLTDCPFVLSEPVDDVLEFLGPVARNKGLDLLWEWDPSLPLQARGDLRRLRQLVLNLTGNAVRATERGHVHITARLEEDDREDMFGLRLEVSDTGPGLSEGERASVFEPFAQGRGEVARKYSGSGLGLVVAKRLVERMGGTIEALNAPGRGARFSLLIPLGRVLQERFLDTASLAGKQVLVLSRYDRSAEILSAQLRHYGIAASAAWFADAAIRELMRLKQLGVTLDLLLIDGDTDGWPSALDWLDRVRVVVAATPAVAVLALGSEIPEEHAGRFAAVWRRPLRIRRLPTDLELALGLPGKGNAESDPPTEVRSHAADPGEAEWPPSSVPEPYQGNRVLLVEDNRLNQRIAIRLLERLGCSVLAVGDGKEAIRAAADESFDAILMDCQMPEMDGYTATREIRALEAGTNRHTPIIALTAYAVEGDREQCLDAGMDDYMTKPVTFDQLRLMLGRWIGNPGRERASSSASGQ